MVHAFPRVGVQPVRDAYEDLVAHVRFTSRTAGSELFVNPPTGVYFTVDLAILAHEAETLARDAALTQPTSTGSSSRPYTMDTLRNESSSAGTARRRFGNRRTSAGYAVRSSIRASSAPMQRWMP